MVINEDKKYVLTNENVRKGFGNKSQYSKNRTEVWNQKCEQSQKNSKNKPQKQMNFPNVLKMNFQFSSR